MYCSKTNIKNNSKYKPSIYELSEIAVNRSVTLSILSEHYTTNPDSKKDNNDCVIVKLPDNLYIDRIISNVNGILMDNGGKYANNVIDTTESVIDYDKYIELLRFLRFTQLDQFIKLVKHKVEFCLLHKHYNNEFLYTLLKSFRSIMMGDSLRSSRKDSKDTNVKAKSKKPASDYNSDRKIKIDLPEMINSFVRSEINCEVFLKLIDLVILYGNSNDALVFLDLTNLLIKEAGLSLDPANINKNYSDISYGIFNQEFFDKFNKLPGVFLAGGSLIKSIECYNSDSNLNFPPWSDIDIWVWPEQVTELDKKTECINDDTDLPEIESIPLKSNSNAKAATKCKKYDPPADEGSESNDASEIESKPFKSNTNAKRSPKGKGKAPGKTAPKCMKYDSDEDGSESEFNDEPAPPSKKMLTYDSEEKYEKISNDFKGIINNLEKLLRLLIDTFKQRKIVWSMRKNVITLYCSDYRRNIQIILMDELPEKIISQFDIDYVKAYYSKGKIFGTIQFLLSNIKKQISDMSDDTPSERIIKAFLKGYTIDDKIKTKNNLCKNEFLNNVAVKSKIENRNSINDEITKLIGDVTNKFYFPTLDEITSYEKDCLDSSNYLSLMNNRLVFMINKVTGHDKLYLSIDKLLIDATNSVNYDVPFFSTRYEHDGECFKLKVIGIDQVDTKKLVPFSNYKINNSPDSRCVVIPIKYSFDTISEKSSWNKLCFTTDPIKLQWYPFYYYNSSIFKSEDDYKMFTLKIWNYNSITNSKLDIGSKKLFDLISKIDNKYETSEKRFYDVWWSSGKNPMKLKCKYMNLIQKKCEINNYDEYDEDEEDCDGSVCATSDFV